ncbi:MAG: hypothetical protein QM711_00555 [Micropruina sp.]|uniref:hypothetical protein n=1 Tax=Micropruina sp. TaxID=2737536 RepID=UPI0039E5FBA5
MSAMLVEEMVVASPSVRPRWRHVPQTRGPVARPSHPASPVGRPAVAAAPPLVRARVSAPVEIRLGQGLQLTRRGLAVVMAVFLGAVAAGVLTLLGGFLAVSNDPGVPQSPSVIQAG